MKHFLLALLLLAAVPAHSSYLADGDLIEGVTSTATAAGTTTLTKSSTRNQIFTGVTTQTVKLPNATLVKVGKPYIIHNNSTGSVTVQDNGSNTLATLLAGEYATFLSTSAGSANGSWDIKRPGAGTGGTASRAAEFNGSGLLVSDANVSTTELGFLDNVTSSLCGINQSCTETNKTFKDSTTIFGDDGDVAKALVFSLGGATTAKTMTIVSSHSNNRSVTLPDATTTLVGTDTTDVLSGKSMSGSSNTFTNIPANTALTSTVPKANGGTAQDNSSLTFPSSGTVPAITPSNHGLVVSSATAAATVVAPNASTVFPLISGGASADPAWAALGPTGGGTGLTSYTTGDLPYASNTNVLSKLGIGSSGQFLKVSGSAPAWGAGATGINYLSGNSDGEVDTTGWTMYDDAAAAPVDGTGGVLTSTWTRVAAATLRGSGYFLFTHPASNVQGEGVCYAFTLDSADKAKPLQVTYDYQVVSGTYLDGDLTDYLIDVTNSTVIQPAPYTILSATAGLTQKRIVSFQTSATGSSYKYCIHQALTSASAFTVGFDNFNLGPTYSAYGAVQLDEKSVTITPSAGFGTTSLQSTWVGRKGDKAVFRGYFKCGTTAASAATLALPAGYVIDSTKFAATASVQEVGTYRNIQTGGAAAVASGTLYYDGSSTGTIFLGSSSASNVITSVLGNAQFNSSDGVSYDFEVPISGWSSNVQVSSDADTRVTAVQLSGSTTSLTSSEVTIAPTTVVKDSHGAWSGSTYTVAVPGWYQANGYLQGPSASYTANDSLYVGIKQNAGSTIIMGHNRVQTTATRSLSASGSAVVYCNAGDTLVFRGQSTTTGNAVDFAGSIFRLSGPAQIAASEKVRLKYQNTAGTSITSTITTVPYATKIYDSHSAFNGATGVFTAPRADYYRLQVRGRLQSVNNSTAQVVEIEAIVTSTPESLSAGVQQLDARFGNGAAHVQNFGGGGTWWLNQGDTIAVQVANTNTIGLDTTVGYNVIQIESQGGI